VVPTTTTTTSTTMSTFVWVHLYLKGEDKPTGNPVKIKPIPEDVDALARRLKDDDLKEDLQHCSRRTLFVYPPGTNVTAVGGPDKDHYKPGKKLFVLIEELENATPPTPIDNDDHPLIVVAPGPRQQQQENPQTHINRSDSVFVLYENTDKGPDPIATAFAVSDSLLMTAAHTVVERQGVDDDVDVEKVDDAQEQKERKADLVVKDLMVALVLDKEFDGTITAQNGRAVTLEKYHFHHDWAFLKLKPEAGRLEYFIPLATSPNELPQRGTLEKMYTYHCPVRIFLNARKAASVHALVKEVNVATIDSNKKFLSFQNGGFSGSSGGPYIFRNKAVALHSNSANDAVAFEMLQEELIQDGDKKRKLTFIEKTKEVAESSASSYACLGTGLILQARSGLMKVYKGDIEA